MEDDEVTIDWYYGGVQYADDLALPDGLPERVGFKVVLENNEVVDIYDVDYD